MYDARCLNFNLFFQSLILGIWSESLIWSESFLVWPYHEKKQKTIATAF